MNNGLFDFTTLVFLIAAVFIFFKLRSVLGRRTGHEKPPFDPYARREDQQRNPHGQQPDEGEQGDNVVVMPRREGVSEELIRDQQARQQEARDAWMQGIEKIAPEGSELRENIDALRELDSSFYPPEFLKGAAAAYEMIVTAFAAGDRKTLKNLLSKDVYAGFDGAIADRESRQEQVLFKFIGITEENMEAVSLEGKMAYVTVRFRSEIVSATKDAEDRVIDGDPAEVSDVVDIWTFARDTTSRDPNWKLVGTEAGA